MNGQHVFYAILAGIIVFGIIAVLLKDRLRLLLVRWGNKSARLEAHPPQQQQHQQQPQGAGVRLKGIDSSGKVIATDKTGRGVDAQNIVSKDDATFLSEPPPKP